MSELHFGPLAPNISQLVHALIARASSALKHKLGLFDLLALFIKLGKLNPKHVELAVGLFAVNSLNCLGVGLYHLFSLALYFRSRIFLYKYLKQ